MSELTPLEKARLAKKQKAQERLQESEPLHEPDLKETDISLTPMPVEQVQK